MLDADGKIKLPEMRNNELDENSDVTLLKRQVLMLGHLGWECRCLREEVFFFFEWVLYRQEYTYRS